MSSVPVQRHSRRRDRLDRRDGIAFDARNLHQTADGVNFHLDGGPIVARGKVIFGVSLGTDTPRGGCFIVALDAKDGSEVWRFHTVAQPGQPGGDS